jgi:putative hydrolase of the HAD superfamily
MLQTQGLEGIKGVLFDCYKTLIDIQTDENSLDTYKPISSWLIYQGVKITPEELMAEYRGSCRLEIESGFEKYPEVKVERVFAGICKNHALWNIDEAVVGIETARTFRASSLRRLQAFPQSLRLLDQLTGYSLGIVSNGQRVFSELELKYLDLYKRFPLVIFSSDLGYKKPDPRIFLAATEHLGLRPEEVMFVGDSFDNDIIPAIQLGMKAMHIEEAWRFFKTI